MKKSLLTLALLAQASLVSATTMIYTSEASFTPNLTGLYYLEDFSSFSAGSLGNTQAFGPVNGYSWTASRTPGNSTLWINNSTGTNPSLSTNDAGDDLSITFGANVTAVGGIISATDQGGNTISEMITITLNDGSTQSFTGSGFAGFISDTAISFLTISAPDASNPTVFNWPQLDHFYVGAGTNPTGTNPSPAPEPATLALLGLGLLGLGMSRRSRN